MHVRDWIDRWQAHGLVDDEVAMRLRADVEEAEPAVVDRPTRQLEPEGGRDLLDAIGGLVPGRSLVLEAVGYLGAALTIGALGVLFDFADWPRPVVAMLLLATSGLAGWGVFQLTPTTTGAGSRLAAVLGAASVGSLSGGLFLLFEPDCLDGSIVPACTWWQENLVPFLILTVVTAAAAVLHRRHTTALGHLVLGLSAGSLTWSVAHLPFAPRARTLWQAEEATFGVLLMLVAWAWTWGSETGRLRPSWVGTFGAGGAFFAGLLMATGYDPIFGGNDDVSIVASLVAGVTYLAAGLQMDRVRLTIVGAVALLFTVPATLREVLGLDEAAITLVMLPTGLALTAWAVFAARRDRDRETAPTS